MKLLIVTQKIDKNDSILGFFHRWVIEFAKHFERVSVICLEKGEYDLPENVKVFSLGKEEGKSKLKYILRFYKYIWSLRDEYDAVFVHMNPEYLILAGEIWKLLGKKIGLWYTHREKNLKLRLAAVYPDVIFTASKESFTLANKKVRIVGHGIDVAAYDCPEYVSRQGIRTLLQVGRITPIKHCDNAIEALAILGNNYKLKFIGGPGTISDKSYFESLKKLAVESSVADRVEFAGSVPNADMAKIYCDADATLNLTPTGGVDKAVLESMAAGRITFSSNQTFADYFGDHKDQLLLRDNQPETIAKAVREIFESDKWRTIPEALKESARERASVESLIRKIASAYDNIDTDE
ncbi:glycosyltransferase family 4 protein [Candidatus Parcubacteria bacterium]|nr:glycosyltransferase family 4 protein [Candidatus Parcubacteria bacterium]